MSGISSLITQGVNTLNSVPSGAWTALLASPVLSGALQAIKHWLSIQNEKVMFAIVTVVCFLTAAVYYLMHTPTNNPWILAAQTAILGFMTQPFYYLAVKPLYKKFMSQAVPAAIQSAAIGPEGLPISGQVVATTVAPDPKKEFSQSIQLEDFSQ
jgi:hypothetical protein